MAPSRYNPGTFALQQAPYVKRSLSVGVCVYALQSPRRPHTRTLRPSHSSRQYLLCRSSIRTPVGFARTHSAAARGSNAGISCTKATEAPAGGRAVQTASDSNQRIRELVAKIETEQNQEKFSALVEELNRLLDSDQPVRKPPKSSA